MYKKRKTLTIPVEYKEVVVPSDKVPDYADVRYIVNGEVTQGTPIPEGVLVAYSDNAEEVVVIEYDKVEEVEREDTVTPIVNALGDLPRPERVSMETVENAIERLQGAVESIKVPKHDNTDVVRAIVSLRDTLLQKSDIEDTDTDDVDYTEKLDAILARLPEGTDISEVTALLRQLVEKETPQGTDLQLLRDKEGRIKVEVDRTGFGGLTGVEAGHLKTIAENNVVYTTLWDSTTTADTIYLGEATPGTISSEAKWRMQRINTATGRIEWADSGTFTQVWDNRESLTYA